MTLALTHRSWSAEHNGGESNERLEFLGDAVLGLAVAARAYAEFPEMSEGEFSKLRAAVVNAVALAEVAVERGIGAHLRLGKGEEASGGREKPSILADAVEALIGAVYLDGGWNAAREVVGDLVGDRLFTAAEEGPGGHDHKTRLQEWAAQHFDGPPRYELSDEGPDHEKRFFATVWLAGERWGTGEGRSKKQAEQAAAGAAWPRAEQWREHPAQHGTEVPVERAEHDHSGDDVGAEPAGRGETADAGVA